MTTPEQFPILRANFQIPWFVIEQRKAQAQKNFGQTLEQLAARGGLTWSETLCVLENRDNIKQDPDYSRRRVLMIVEREQAKRVISS